MEEKNFLLNIADFERQESCNYVKGMKDFMSPPSSVEKYFKES